MLKGVTSLEKIILISSLFARVLKSDVAKLRVQKTFNCMPQKYAFIIARNFLGVENQNKVIEIRKNSIEKMELEALDAFLSVYYGNCS